MIRGDTHDARYLGVDMGGSQTRAHLIAAPAPPRSWQAPGGNVALDPAGARDVLLALVREAAPAVACLGVAGARTAPDAVARLAEELGRETSVTLLTDADLALTAAFGTAGDGIVVCAGTGTVAAVRQAGETHLVGGHGYLLDDAGSAYDIGRRLVVAALRDRDRGDGALAGELEAALGEPLDALVRRVYADPTDRQPLAQLARRAPELQHSAAAAILAEAGDALAQLADTARERFGPLPVRLAGGVFRIPSVTEALRRSVGAEPAPVRPEVAAAQLAARAGARLAAEAGA